MRELREEEDEEEIVFFLSRKFSPDFVAIFGVIKKKKEKGSFSSISYLAYIFGPIVLCTYLSNIV